MDEEKLKFLDSLVRHPEETSFAEFKAAVKFDPQSEFGAKLVKHILGMANAGGGYVVIGCREGLPGKLEHDPNLTNEISKSYETTRLSECVDSFLSQGQRIRLQVHKVSIGDKTFPIISVEGFHESPFFCGRSFLGGDKKPILSENAVYIRDFAAKTVLVAGPQQWSALLKVAVEQNQAESLEKMKALLSQMGLSGQLALPGAEKKTEEEEWVQAQRASALATMNERGVSHSGYMEVVHAPLGTSKIWSQDDLLAAAQKAVLRHTGWPIGVVLTVNDLAPRPTSDGIRASIYTTTFGITYDFWSLSKNGSFYFLRTFYEDFDERFKQKVLLFDGRIWAVAETFLHCASLYRALGLPTTTEIEFKISHQGLRSRVLSAGNRMRAFSLLDRFSDADTVSWSGTAILGAIPSDLDALVRAVLSELFILFEFWKPADEVWTGVLEEFLKARV